MTFYCFGPDSHDALMVASGWWAETVVGDLWFDWDYWEDETGQTIFAFKHRRHAEMFDAMFHRKAISYVAYKEFWLNQFGRDRLDNTFLTVGWTPEVVIPSTLSMTRRRILDGGRVLFRRNVGWFFERERDAMVFLFEDIE